MTKLFVLSKIYPKRQHLFPLLKPFEKSEEFSDEDRIKHYGISETEVEFVTRIHEANYVILPMSWNFYQAENKMKEAIAVVQQSHKLKKCVLSFMVGDFGVKIPYFENVLVFRNSGETTKLPESHVGLPVFIEDPLSKYFDTTRITIREYREKPKVGFCGQANGSVTNAGTEILKTLVRNTKSNLAISKAPSQQVLSTSYLRASVLKTLLEDDRIHDNFILRKQYRAGASTAESRKITTREFYDNLQQSDYVVCVRGAGNFSVRFYETLAMGRIPVFIDTNCLLPLAHQTDWKKHVVWVEYKDRKKVASKVRDFHDSLTAKEFKSLQQQNRILWEEHLSLGGFFKTYLSDK